MFVEEGDVDKDSIRDLLENIPELILPLENKNLINPFTEVDITSVIWGMEPDKAPGPDGFSCHFYKTIGTL